MVKYVLKRLLWMIPVIAGVSLLIFTLMYFVPGNLAQIILGPSATQVEIQAKELELGLKDPFLVQLGRFLKQTFIDFDLGKSYITSVPVKDELVQRFPRTLILAIASTMISLGVGVPLGVTAAVHQDKPADYLTMAVALLGISTPGFWLALMMVLLFAVKLHWVPATGIIGFKSWILPCISNAVIGISTQARQSRSSMLDVIHSDYIVMARSKGLSENKVIWGHALPNALIPVITIAGSVFGNMMGGSLIIESVFAIPGVGYYMIGAVNNRDYMVVRSCVILLSIVFSLIVLLTDLVLAAIDPRIKSQFAGSVGRKKIKRRKENE